MWVVYNILWEKLFSATVDVISDFCMFYHEPMALQIKSGTIALYTHFTLFSACTVSYWSTRLEYLSFTTDISRSFPFIYLLQNSFSTAGAVPLFCKIEVSDTGWTRCHPIRSLLSFLHSCLHWYGVGKGLRQRFTLTMDWCSTLLSRFSIISRNKPSHDTIDTSTRPSRM